MGQSIKDILEIYHSDLEELISFKKRELKRILREFQLAPNQDNWDLSLKMDRSIGKTKAHLDLLVNQFDKLTSV